MYTAWKIARIVLQMVIIMGITFIGNQLQHILHIPLAGSIVGLGLFFALLQFKIIPERLVKHGAEFFLATMVFFFIPSVVGSMNIVSEINANFILFFILVVIGTALVALVSGFIAERLTHKLYPAGRQQ